MGKVMKKNEGITLIALIITIIVLILLAGISISMISGQDGLLSRAGKTTEMQSNAQVSEAMSLIYNEYIIEQKTKGNTEDFIDYVKATGKVNDNAVVDTKKLTGGKIALGNGTDSSDVYKLEKVGNDYVIRYYGENEDDEIKTIWSSTGDVADVDKNIDITYEEIETESRAIYLKVYASYMPEQTYEQYAREYVKGIPDGPELVNIFVDGYCYFYNVDSNEVECRNYSTVEEYFNTLSDKDDYKDYIDYMVKNGIIDLKGYIEDIKKLEFSINCNGNTEVVSIFDKCEYVTDAINIKNDEPMVVSAEFPIILNGRYEINVQVNNKYNVKMANVTKCKTEIFSSICNTNTEYISDGYTVTIPAGFAYGTSANVNSVNTGFVITDSVDINGNSTGNEFVWIPVDKTNLTVGNTEKKIAEISSGSDYEGVLYDFDGETSTEMTGTKSYREPDVLWTYDNKAQDTVKITKDKLQEEYNDMIESIQQYGGFYVARYETGNENEMAISKINVIPIGDEINPNTTWYGLYSLAKTYTNSKNSVTSQMIWGSQYDAMLNFALTGNDKSKVTSTEYGNYSNTLLKTGLTRTSDKINNIYDLGGNSVEWISEACDTDYRADRGGSYNNSDPATNRNSDYPTNSGPSDSMRSSLYVE